MQKLCKKLYSEVVGVFNNASRAYSNASSSLDAAFFQPRLNTTGSIASRLSKQGKKSDRFIIPGPNLPQQQVKKVYDKLYKVRKTLEEISFDGSLDSYANAMHSMSNAYDALNDALPTQNEVDELVEDVFDRHDKTRHGTWYGKFLKKVSPATGLISGALAYTNFTNGETPETIVSAGAALSAFYSSFAERPFYGLAVSHLGLGAALLYPAITGDSPLPFDDPLTRTGLGWFGVLNLTLGGLSGIKGVVLGRVKSAAKQIKFARREQEKLPKIGIALEEGKRNLGYVMRVCESEGRDPSEFQNQVDTLKKAMEDYLHGDGSYDDLVKARIEYVPSEREKFAIKPKLVSIPSGPTKKGYTQEEWELMRQQRTLETGERKERFKVKEARADVFVEDFAVPTFNYSVSPGLQEQYFEGRRRVEGINIVQLMDMARQKIEGVAEARLATNGDLALEHSNRVTLITQKGEWSNMQKRIRERHGLSDSARIYVLHPHKYLRCIFSTERDGNNITLLEVLTHDEYDRLKKSA